MTDADMTPMRQQYLEIKAQHPEKIVLFRLGDFYETFDGDAETVARELDITLTGRGTKNRHPMAGVPYHAVDTYVAKLVERGFHVVIVDQMEPPGKKLVRREVTKIITPGTVVDPAMLEQRQNNYLMALCPEQGKDGRWSAVGIAYADVTTGEFAATQLGGDSVEPSVAMVEEFARLRPREVVIAKFWADKGITLPNGAFMTVQPDHRFENTAATRILREHFDVTTLSGIGLADKPLAARAAGAALAYLRDTQKSALPSLSNIRVYSTSAFMVLDANTRRNLELTETIRGSVRGKGSLLSVLDRTVTPMGSRLLRTWITSPLLDTARLNARLDAVEVLVTNGMLRAEVIAALKPVADLERLANRAISGQAGPRELLALQEGLNAVPALRQLIAPHTEFSSLTDRFDPCPDVTELVSRAIAENAPAVLNEKTGVIRGGFSEELDSIIHATSDAKDWIGTLEDKERERSGIKSLRVSFNKVFGYYIEISHANTDKVPVDYIRKQTLVNAERYITPELKEYETVVLNAEERMLDIETRLFREICSQIGECGDKLLRTARAIAHLDVFVSFAETAAREGYCRPTLSDDETLVIREGRHPVVEKLLSGERFVPNDVEFNGNSRLHLIFGPNMAGKSTAIRQVALITLMAQIGSFVPASEAHIGLVDRIFTRIGAQDEIHSGQSTFMVEMTETAALLNASTPRSLLILDEIGRGTSTYDGLAIARAVVEYVHNSPRLNCRTLFATHYHELTVMPSLLPRVQNFNVAVLEEGDKVVFLHRLVPGGADRSYGIHVASLAGMPRPLIKRAQEILSELEAESSDFQVNHRPGSTTTPDDHQPPPRTDHPAVDALRNLRIDEYSPLEAMTKLYELQRLVKEVKVT